MMLAAKPSEVVLSLPGKVFIAGEYLALKAGSALVAALSPRFQLKVRISEKSALCPFHPDSPAGKFWLLHKDFFEQFQIGFEDPYQGLGGMGGSSAEFALLHGLYQLGMEAFGDAQSAIDIKRALEDYQSVSATAGYRPSGADLVGQFRGGLTHFNKAQGTIQNFSWRFDKLSFLVFRTGKKLKTHEHLSNLTEFSETGLKQHMEKLIAAVSSGHSEIFVSGINAYHQELFQLGFVSSFTLELLNHFDMPEVLAKKGCGAQGADTILLVCKTEAKPKLCELAKELGLSLIADEQALSSGLEKRIEPVKELEVSHALF